MMDYIVLEKLVEERQEQMIALRREFHSVPELGFEEYTTTDKICQRLKEMGVVPHLLAPTGVFAYIGEPKGFTVALRADIDGLLVKEETGLSFASCHEGKMHACGHDGHIASLLGAASVLKELEEQLPIRVKLIFQPSEENARGAEKIIKQGVLEDVDVVFGLHLFSDLETGVVSVEQGPRMAQTDRFKLIFYGKGGHAGKPHQCVDATIMAADFAMSTQTIVSREVNPIEGAVVTIGSFHSGTQYNIISGMAELSGSCRSFSSETAFHLKEAIKKRAQAVADYYGGSVSIDYDLGAHPPVINPPDFTEEITQAARKLLGEKMLQTVPEMMLGEDFSWYQTKVPGVFAFVGCGFQGRENYPNHHPRFDINEDSLKLAASLHVAAVMAATEMRPKGDGE